jgi:parvulin-like peptidyl-prolyl isomerase
MSLNSFGNKLRTGPVGAIFFGIVVLCVGVLAFTGLGQYNSNRHSDDNSQKTPSDILAYVDKTPVTISQFQGALTAVKNQYAAYAPPSILSAAQMRSAAFNQVENPILMAALAKEHNLTLSADDISAERNKELKHIKSELGLSDSASESDVESALATQRHSLSEFINEDVIKTDLSADKYRNYLLQSNQASEATVLKYYTQVHTRHILIDDKKRPSAQAFALTKDLIDRLNKGASFVSLVKQYSDDTASIKTGGDDKFIDQTTQYVPEFKNAALALKPGQITQTPVSSQFGYFIIQALAVRSNLPKDYKAKHQQYVTQVTQALAEQQGSTEMAAEKAKLSVNVIDNRLKGDLAYANPTGPASLQTALNDYNTALKGADDSDAGEIYATQAEIYQQLGQSDKAMTAFQNALTKVEDPTLRMMLGDIYKQKGDAQDALIQYQKALDNAFDDPGIHMRLAQDYKTLKKPQLAAAQSAWITQYLAHQKQASAGQSLPQ